MVISLESTLGPLVNCSRERRRNSEIGCDWTRMDANSQELDQQPSPNSIPLNAHKRIVAATVGIVGLGVIVFLTRYNYLARSIWGGTSRTFDEFLLVNITLLIFPPCLHVVWILRENLARSGMQAPARG